MYEIFLNGFSLVRVGRSSPVFVVEVFLLVLFGRERIPLGQGPGHDSVEDIVSGGHPLLLPKTDEEVGHGPSLRRTRRSWLSTRRPGVTTRRLPRSGPSLYRALRSTRQGRHSVQNP